MEKEETQTILVIDDNRVNLKLLSGILSREGYRVRVATGGRLALDSVKLKIPDLVLSDLRMPDMDGHEVCRRLKADEATKDIPVIFISGATEMEEKVKSFSVGGVDYISKPFNREEILFRTRVHLSIRKLQNQLLQSNLTLEKKVIERTAEIESANEELLRNLKEKDTLIKEIHHRVKNNLLVLYGLITFQQEKLAKQPDIYRLLEEIKTRIKSMGKVYQLACQSKNVAEILFSDYIESFVKELKKTYREVEKEIEVNLNLEPVVLDLDIAVPCSLIISELLINVFKHAFPAGKHGAVTISLTRKGERNELRISDNGIGMPEELMFGEVKTLGLKLVSMLTEQIHGKLAYRREKGSLFTISF